MQGIIPVYFQFNPSTTFRSILRLRLARSGNDNVMHLLFFNYEMVLSDRPVTMCNLTLSVTQE
jgi:hypothetical protein